MALSRRRFLRAGTMVSLSAVIPLKGVVSVLAQETGANPEVLFQIPAESIPDDRLTEEAFSRHVYSKFRVYTSLLTAIELDLIDVKRGDTPSAKQAPRPAKLLDSFSVIFRGPRNAALESKTYRITHDQMGTFDLFISPINDRKKERLYQAVFNRFRQH